MPESTANGTATPLESKTPSAPAPIRLPPDKRLALNIGEVVALMMRTPGHRHMFLADLEWLVLPAIVSGQYSLAEARDPKTGLSIPTAMVTWAMVNEEADRRLAAEPGAPLRLRPGEWTSGQIPWIVDACGDPRAIANLIQSLLGRRFQAKEVKIVARGSDGKPSVQILKAELGGQGPAPAAADRKAAGTAA